MSKQLILSASSASYFNFIQGLIFSLQPAKNEIEFDIALFDLGLNKTQLAWLEQYVKIIKKAEWKFGITDADQLPMAYKGILSRPFIPLEFPGYDNYLYIDADAWVQDKQAIAHYFQAAKNACIAIVPEIDRAYSCYFKDREEYRDFIHKTFSECVGEKNASLYRHYPILNAGLFALPRHSRIWQQWETTLANFLKKTRHHCVEQTALNKVIFDHYDLTDPKQIQLLPATHNWLCHLCLPAYDEINGQWTSPYIPHEKIGIIHRSSDAFKTAEFVNVKTIQGNNRLMNLKFQEGAYDETDPPADRFNWQQRHGKKF